METHIVLACNDILFLKNEGVYTTKMAVLLFTFFSLTFLGVMAACACFSLVSGRLLLRAGSLRLLFPYFRPTSFCVMAACACFFLVSGRLLLHAGSLRLLFLALDRFFTDFGQLVQRKLSSWYIDAGWLFHMQGGGMRRSGGYGDWRQRSRWKIRQVNVSGT